MAGHTPWRKTRAKLAEEGGDDRLAASERAATDAYEASREFRGWLTVPGLDIESDQAERLLTILLEHHGELGPVLSGARDGLQVVVTVAAEGESEAMAAAELYAAVADGLRRAHLGDRYPTAIELARVDCELADQRDLSGSPTPPRPNLQP
jgi:dsDNA-binding SOS-regulon protein